MKSTRTYLTIKIQSQKQSRKITDEMGFSQKGISNTLQQLNNKSTRSLQNPNKYSNSPSGYFLKLKNIPIESKCQTPEPLNLLTENRNNIQHAIAMAFGKKKGMELVLPCGAVTNGL